MPQLSPNQRRFAAHVRFLREKRLWSYERIGRRYWMDPERIETIHRQATQRGIRPEQQL